MTENVPMANEQNNPQRDQHNQSNPQQGGQKSPASSRGGQNKPGQQQQAARTSPAKAVSRAAARAASTANVLR